MALPARVIQTNRVWVETHNVAPVFIRTVGRVTCSHFSSKWGGSAAFLITKDGDSHEDCKAAECLNPTQRFVEITHGDDDNDHDRKMRRGEGRPDRRPHNQGEI